MVPIFPAMALDLALQGCVDDRQPLLPTSEGHVGDAQHAAQFIVGNPHWTWRRRSARRRLRKRGRPCAVEGDVALDLLHDLMDVAVEHGYRDDALGIVELVGLR